LFAGVHGAVSGIQGFVDIVTALENMGAVGE